MKCECGKVFVPRYKQHKVCQPGCPAREKELNKQLRKPSRKRRT